MNATNLIFSRFVVKWVHVHSQRETGHEARGRRRFDLRVCEGSRRDLNIAKEVNPNIHEKPYQNQNEELRRVGTGLAGELGVSSRCT